MCSHGFREIIEDPSWVEPTTGVHPFTPAGSRNEIALQTLAARRGDNSPGTAHTFTSPIAGITHNANTSNTLKANRDHTGTSATGRQDHVVHADQDRLEAGVGAVPRSPARSERASQPTSMHRSISESFAQIFSSARRSSLDIRSPENEQNKCEDENKCGPGDPQRSMRTQKASFQFKPEEQEEYSGYSRGEASIQDHLKLRALEKDMSMLHILQFDRTMEWRIRTDMNRFDLLEECRKSLIPSGIGETGAKRRGQQSDLGVALQLRDIRCLQGVSEPALLVRRGAIIVSLEPVKAIVTCESAYVVIPDGADELLVPL